MSRNAVEARVRLYEAALKPGGTATLRFVVDASEPVKIRGAHVEFRGYEETKATYTTTTSNGRGGTTTTTHTAVERNVLVEAQKTFRGKEGQGFFSNLVDGALSLVGGGEHEILKRGQHEARLELDLPDHLPEAVAGEKVKIAYEAELHLDIPAARDFRHVESLPLAAHESERTAEAEPLSIRYPEDSGRGFFDKVFGPEVSVRVVMPSTVVERGDRLRGNLEVRFRGDGARLKAIVCEVVRLERTRARGHSDRVTKTVVTHEQAKPAMHAGTLFASFVAPVPETLLPSCSGKNFDVTHELRIVFDVAWAKDPKVTIPITVL